ncbi:MAG: F0F1 ATP synthase subunit B [Bacteroidia bacterium]|nr:F0F1 ATP synthase subunit B [Bacteroidia bacterium]
MPLVMPEFGLMIWMLITFVIVLLLLRRYAWKPILKMIKTRETSIEESLRGAEKARDEIKELYANNERIINEARVERDKLIKDSNDAKETIISEAKTKAKTEADRIVTSARETINNEKMAAITELKNQVAALSIEIAEKILKEHLSNDENQKALVNNYVKDINLN